MRTDDTYSTAAADFADQGYALLPAFLSADELAPAQAELGLLFPTAEEYHDDVDPERNARFRTGAFSGLDPFPYPAVEWSLLGLTPPVVRLAETLLGTDRIRLSEAHNWAKYTGASEYEQALHRDYGNHTVLVPTADERFGEVELFLYLFDVPADAGPTRVVSRTATNHLPSAQRQIHCDRAPELYDQEIAATGPAGTVLAYRNDTFHRGSAMTAARGARFLLKVSFRPVGPFWMDSLSLTSKADTPAWHAFVRRATPRMLELVGFPPPGDPFWTADTYAGLTRRYADADLAAFAPHPPTA
jgi:hypothetical protein